MPFLWRSFHFRAEISLSANIFHHLIEYNWAWLVRFMLQLIGETWKNLTVALSQVRRRICWEAFWRYIELCALSDRLYCFIIKYLGSYVLMFMKKGHFLPQIGLITSSCYKTSFMYWRYFLWYSYMCIIFGWILNPLKYFLILLPCCRFSIA